MMMMEALLLVPLLLVPLSLYLISFRRESSKNLPPGTHGWPILAENISMALSGPEKFIEARMRKHSPEVFRTSLMGEKMAVLCGARGNKFLFTNENTLLTTWWPDSVRKTLFPPEYADKDVVEVSSVLRSFKYDTLKAEALRHHVPVMDSMARDQMNTHWMPGSVVKVFPLLKKYTFDLACKIFMDVVDPVQIERLFDPFTLATRGMFSVPIDLPGTAYNGAMKGGKLVREELIKIIAGRREELIINNDHQGRKLDMLSKMLAVRDDEGELISDTVICNNIIGLLSASFDTTSSTMASIFSYLAQLPHVYAEVLREQMEIAESKGPDELLTWDDIEKMKYSWNVAREAMRLTPPGFGSFREAKMEFNYAGFTIPKGWKTFWTVHSTYKNPDYFPEPEKFDPSRFEGSGPPPYTFVPFGGGPRMCPGREYARLQVLVFMHNVVTRFRLEKTIPNEKIVMRLTPTPAQGLPLHLHPHEN